MIPDLLEIPAIHAAYRAGTLTPAELIAALYDRIEAYADKAVFISRISREDALAQANALDVADIERKPLLGIPYVVKDNIDAAGMPTTAACPDFAYTPAIDSTAVARLRAAGAILLGKANLDQFATGLNGSRSPYGAPRSVFNADYVSGGSSSGSAVSVGAGLAAFALGTDTAGSGRVPAAFNNLIGLKPSIGRIPTTGVVPACRSLDCISIFANSASDSIHILKILQGYDEADPYARPPAEVFLPATPRIGVLPPAQRDFAGDADCAALYETALVHARHLGWELVEIDYAPFKTIAAALYGGPFVAERLAAIKDFFSANPEALHPVVRDIIEGAQKYSAADTFQEIYRIRRLCRIAEAERAKCDALLLPTSPTIYRVDEMLADPFAKNATFGLYTNFVNFMDLGAIALPVGFRPDGMPFGVSLIGAAFTESSLAAYADSLHRSLGAGAGKDCLKPSTSFKHPAPETTIVVAGAHLSGMVLNHELQALGAKLVTETTTAGNYKLFALSTKPPKPGLVRTPNFQGNGIAIEIWSLTAENFGRFVSALPAPMGIGKVTLADGSVHTGFLCEAHALEGAEDITHYGGWRAFMASKLNAPAPPSQL